MATGTNGAPDVEAATAPASPPNSTDLAKRGIYSGHDFANFMSALITDLATGAVTTEVANAQCNAAGKLLKVAEMQLRHGARPGRTLQLATGPGEA